MKTSLVMLLVPLLGLFGGCGKKEEVSLKLAVEPEVTASVSPEAVPPLPASAAELLRDWGLDSPKRLVALADGFRVTR